MSGRGWCSTGGRVLAPLGLTLMLGGSAAAQTGGAATPPAAADPQAKNPQAAAAQPPQPGMTTTADPDRPFYLGRVDVTVTAPAPPPGVTVLSGSDARTFDRATLADLLTLAPGITSAAVGPRTEETIYLRGFDLRQTPLYIDGVPVYVPYDGYVDLARFLTADVAEVRVSRGLTSGLYGPNTLGGAINVVSRRPTGPFEAIGAANFGSGERRELNLHAGTRAARWYATGGIARLQRDTYPLSSDFTATALQDDGDRLNAYARDTKGTATIGYAAEGGTELALRLVRQRGEKGNPTYAGNDPVVRPRFWQWPEWNKDSVYAIGNVPFGANAAGWLRVRGYYDTFVNGLFSYDDATYTTQARPSSFRSHYDDYTVGTTIEAGWRISPRVTVRGTGHVKQDNHKEHNEGEPWRRIEDRVLSGGVEGTVLLSSRWTLVTGVSADQQRTQRAEDYQNGVVSEFPHGRSDGVNPQAAVSYAFADGSRFHFGASRKTRLPSIKDRYSYRMGQAVPNADLRAERATSVEAGYEALLAARARASVTGFYIDVDDLVQRFYLQPNLYQLRNVGRVAHSGVEAELRGGMGRGMEAGVSYSFLHRDSKSEPAVALLDTPSHKVTASLVAAPFASRLQRALTIAAIVSRESRRNVQNDGGTFRRLDGFTRMDLKASWHVHQTTSVEVGASNAFDANYQLADGYPEPGRTVFAGVRFSLGR